MHPRAALPRMIAVIRAAALTLAGVVVFAPQTHLGQWLSTRLLIAQALAFAWGIPALGVHHMEGHLLAPMLEEQPPEFPFVALLVSGGHTQLVRVDGIGRYELLGESLDDAAGEAFDKTAKLIGLNYPGGPEIARLATQGVPGRLRGCPRRRAGGSGARR